MTVVLKNVKHEKFAQLVAQGRNKSEAYREAGFKPDRGAAARLSANVSILARVMEIQSKGAERAEVTVESLIQEAGDIQARAMAAQQYSAATTALVSKAKLAGLWVDKTENLNRNERADLLSDAELSAIARGEGDKEPVAVVRQWRN